MSISDDPTDPRRNDPSQRSRMGKITAKLSPVEGSLRTQPNYPSPIPPIDPWGTQPNYTPLANSWGTQPNYTPPANSWGAQPNYTPPVPPAPPSDTYSDTYQPYGNVSTGVLIHEAMNADPANPREVGISQLRLINKYHNNVLQQAEQSFRWALIAAGIGLVFFLASISFLLLKQPTDISSASLISGGLVELISAINFFLYGKASTQLASFHLYLDRTHRFLLADSVCENLKDDGVRDQTRSELVRKIMEARSSTGLLEKQSSKAS